MGLATIAALTVLGGAAPQLNLSAGVNVALNRDEIVEIIMQMAVYAGFSAALDGLFAVQEVFMNNLKRSIVAVCLGMLLTSSGALLAAEPVHTGFNAPVGIAADANGNLDISNWGGGTVERLSPDGGRHVFADGLAAPAGIAVAENGSIYVATYSGDTIERFDAEGNRETIATNLATPTGIAFGRDGRLLVANRASGEILSLDTGSGAYDVLADGFSTPVGVVEMPDGSIIVSQYGGQVTRVTADGERSQLGQDFGRPGVGIVADGADAIFVVDYGGGSLRRVTFEGESQIITDDIEGSPVALGRDREGSLLMGTWGAGHIYRVPVAFAE